MMDGFEMEFDGDAKDLPEAVRETMEQHYEMKKLMRRARHQLIQNFSEEIRKEVDYACAQLLDFESNTRKKKLRAYFTLIGIARMLACDGVTLDYFNLAVGMFLGMDEEILTDPDILKQHTEAKLCAERGLRITIDHIYGILDHDYESEEDDCDCGNCQRRRAAGDDDA
jgi:hypothetical protein